jgi:ABC-type Na+ efflux pump permease subunit
MLAAGFAFTGLTIFTAVLAQTTRRASRVLSETLRPAALAGTMALLAALAALDAGFAMLALRAVAIAAHGPP